MNNCEILAPCGAFEQLQAAINAGADAIYLGYGEFNARRNAKNFSFEELSDAVKLCHTHGVKVHATLNTLIKDSEIDLIYNDLKDLVKAGVDAVIVQDLGVARIIKNSFPSLEMHASTQLTVHNVSGVRALKELGFKRVVLSRELSEKEIEKICTETDIEIEVFIHGALCMCISGGCYLSSMLGQRSGNRGLCAQPCRLDFKISNREYAISLKDMCHIPYITKLRDMGVTSFKIEGRMKRPEYVYAAVCACKKALNGEKPDLETLKNVFSRSGFTDGYYLNKRDLNMFGFRRKEDVENSEKALKTLAIYKENKQTVPLTLNATVKQNEKACITVSDGVNTVTLYGETPQEAINRPTTRDDVLKQLSKTGGTPYYISSADIVIDSGISYPLSLLNSLRREALNELSLLRTAKKEHQILPLKNEIIKKDRVGGTVIRVLTPEQLQFIQNDTAVILPIKEITKEILDKFDTVIGEVPSLIFPFDEENVKSQLKKLRDCGLKTVVADNIGAIFMASEMQFNVLAGWGMNILNSQTVFALNDTGAKGVIASFESSKKSMEELFNPVPVGIIKYGYLPLMRFRTCPAQGKDGCKNCRGISVIKDRKNIDFSLICNDKRYTTLLNSLPLYASDENITADFDLLYFNLESAKQVKHIFDMHKNGLSPDFSRTKGLYFKNLK